MKNLNTNPGTTNNIGTHKKCTCCEVVKPISEFANSSSSKDGLQYNCRSCNSDAMLRIARTPFGKLRSIYNNMQKSTNRRNANEDINYTMEFTKEDFIERFETDNDFLGLYNEWVESDYARDLAPSFDRKDDYKSYSFSNGDWVTWKDNNKRAKEDMKSGRNGKQNKAIIGLNIDDGSIVHFVSTRAAGRELGISQSSIINNAKGRSGRSGRYIFTYRDED